MFGRLLANRREKKLAFTLYEKLVTAARRPFFYTDLGVPDTIDGRFDMILLHLFLMQHRLEAEGEATASLRQQIQEAMVSDLDRSLRELGVGDMSVGKEMKKIGSAWFGRVNTYTAVMASDDKHTAMKEALARNLYRGTDADASASRMADYVLLASERLADYGLDEIKAVSFDFPCKACLAESEGQGHGQ